MTTSDLISALRNDITDDLKQQLLDALQPLVQERLFGNVFNLQEACRFLNVSQSTLRKMIKNNELPFFKQSGQYFFRQTSLDDWMDRLEKKNYSAAQ